MGLRDQKCRSIYSARRNSPNLKNQPWLLKKNQNQEAPAPARRSAKREPVAPTQEPAQEATAVVQEQPQETAAPPAEPKPQAAEAPSKTYLKAMPLRELADVENVKSEVKNGNIIILTCYASCKQKHRRCKERSKRTLPVH